MSPADKSGYLVERIAQMYDLDQRYLHLKDTPFYVEEAESSGGPVLELGCGTGRVLLEIARRGIEITGIDLAEPMLEVRQLKSILLRAGS